MSLVWSVAHPPVCKLPQNKLVARSPMCTHWLCDWCVRGRLFPWSWTGSEAVGVLSIVIFWLRVGHTQTTGNIVKDGAGHDDAGGTFGRVIKEPPVVVEASVGKKKYKFIKKKLVKFFFLSEGFIESLFLLF